MSNLLTLTNPSDLAAVYRPACRVRSAKISSRASSWHSPSAPCMSVIRMFQPQKTFGILMPRRFARSLQGRAVEAVDQIKGHQGHRALMEKVCRTIAAAKTNKGGRMPCFGQWF